MISLHSYLLIGAVLFAAGVACIMIRKNTIQLLMGIELVLNAAALNFVAFSHFPPAGLVGSPLNGHVVALFIIVLAAAEAAVALALVLSVFRLFRSVNIDVASELKG